MPSGRPSKRQRSPLGERIATLRESAGLSQQQLAEKLHVNQQMVAYWERRAATLRPEQLAALTEALQVSVEQLLGKATPKTRGAGPSGKARRVFEELSKLPRKQQERIVGVVEDLLAVQKGGKAA